MDTRFTIGMQRPTSEGPYPNPSRATLFPGCLNTITSEISFFAIVPYEAIVAQTGESMI